MTALEFTRHAAARIRQRGMRDDDVAVIVAHGTQIGADTYVLRGRDAAGRIAKHKKEIARLERLRNRKVVMAGDAVVTCCRVHGRGWKRLRKSGKDGMQQ